MTNKTSEIICLIIFDCLWLTPTVFCSVISESTVTARPKCDLFPSLVNHGAENKKSQMTNKKSNDRAEFQKQVTLGRAVTVDSEITEQKTVGVSHRQSKRIRQMITLVLFVTEKGTRREIAQL